MVVDRKLKKISKNRFELQTIDKANDLITVKGYKPEELRDIYKELKFRQSQSVMQKDKLEKDIGKLDVDDTPVLRELLEKFDSAKKLMDKDKFEDQMKMVKADLAMLKNQIKEISAAVPEVLRNK